MLVELEKGATSWHFHKLAARPFVTVQVDVRNSPEPQARITTAIEKHTLAGAVARVKIDATQEQAVLLRTDDIHELLEAASAFHVAAIAIEVERANRGRLADAERDLLNGLTPRRALELYLRSKNTPEERLAVLLAAAEELFAEQSE